MSTPRYVWRQLTPEQREEVLAWRKDHAHPWHSPSHRPNYGHLHFLVSAACFEHTPHMTEWPWSSAAEYLEQMGKTEAERVWKEYPVRDYGKKWDDPGM